MKEDRKKEIDLKWNQLIAEIEKPKNTAVQTQTKKTTRTPKVIRRRKGNPDIHIN
jgi:hypothetical protein